jgi:hypothetical protein
LSLAISEQAWASTGLWLPAGKVATVEYNDEGHDLAIQIGSHQESLAVKSGPWKRWPMTVWVARLSKPATEVASPFGGIVYVNSGLGQRAIEPVTIKFRGFTKCPMADPSRPELWEETKESSVPWGELVAGNIIFTLPAPELKNITNMQVIADKYEIIVESIVSYLSYQMLHPYRVVFDVDLPENQACCGYPLVFHVNEIEQLLCDFEHPTPALFTAVTLLAIVSIRENCFDSATETAIATITSSVIFGKLFPGFDPLEFSEETQIALPTLFHELWEIHSRFDAALIPATMAIFQNPEYPVAEVADDMWAVFVRQLCKLGQRDFTKLLERSKPIPLNCSSSMSGLPPYQFVGCE